MIARLGAVALCACGRIGFDGRGDAGGTDVASPDARTIPIYANTDRTLYTIDPVTLAPTMLFDLTRTDAVTPQICDLAVDSAGDLFAFEQFSADMYRVDLATGVLTRIPTSAQTSMYGAAFAPGDVLYGARADQNLYTIDPATGVSTLVGAIGAMPNGD